MLSLQFPIPPRLNLSFSSHHRKKPFSSFTHCTLQKNSSDLVKSRLAGSSNCVDIEENNEIQLLGGLDPELMPKHVAVIMDGNRRWAKNRGLPVQLGHRAGGEAMKQLAINCTRFGVKVITVFAFSTENWVRPKHEEVDFLMSLFEEGIQTDIKELIQSYNMRVSVLGKRCRLPKSLQNQISYIEELAKVNKGSHLVMAMNYSGRYDITEASKRIASKVKDGVLQVKDINETLFEQHLETYGIEFPSPDLLIRTSGELRVSNFMLWQLAYTELLFVHKMFPDFDEADLVQALIAYQQRQRRFGGYKY